MSLLIRQIIDLQLIVSLFYFTILVFNRTGWEISGFRLFYKFGSQRKFQFQEVHFVKV